MKSGRKYPVIVILMGVALMIRSLLLSQALVTPSIQQEEFMAFTPSSAPIVNRLGTDQKDGDLVTAIEIQRLDANQRGFQQGTMTQSQVSGCVTLWNQIQGWSTNEESVPANEKCDKVPTSLTSFHQAYQMHCSEFDSVQRNKAISPKCKMAINIYRVKFRHFLTKRTPANEITDSEVLNERIFSEVTQNPAKAILAAKRLLELDPNSETASKAMLSTSIAEAYSLFIPPGDGRWNNLERLISELKSNLPENSPEITEAEAITSVYGASNLSDAISAAKKIARATEKPGLGFYYLSKRKADQGSRLDAIHFMKEAVQLEPNQLKYSALLAVLSDPGANRINFPYEIVFDSVSNR